ncbi:tRNA (N(6)-L-threonylcarbamoyladenosine(37)-C(2))-methylthiotransferase MtaB [Desulfuribacillus alkaliarsenatis]|uniref:Threonylcarbamoyladenosine tRNA methylthiotransferase MtaB n=1 Tax=Desulfuribacillus alkaliarsenatis TaxID=766136 RepID=A0A1E5G0F8_9FIRM|nr:tRNA (N(6)-L-threonylcarbamoyladenosine(37)-C(2))-methylthiotransferase MtaB [Desulfuribacillus alkaliarsenatis]OEF96233.1 tRNA (N(6)-L-threonylcarbamoyladenosine(37)-C(2))-methylthiotransferase MtaB [Desulfuribacillus alkaliarsenatis]
MKVAFHTLGCKVNQYETATMEQIFQDAGYEIIDFKDTADVYVINTCTVTNLGQKKSRQMIRRAIQKNPDAIITVTGCYAQTAPGEVLEIFGVDLVIGTQDRHKILEYINEIVKERQPINAVADIWQQREFEDLSAPFFGERTRATLKIQEGCTEFCSYCIIPYARGGIRSRKLSSILEQAELIVKQGYKEIVLAGIHLGAYGRDLDNVKLIDVLKALEQVEGLERIRISSIEATELNDELLLLMQQSNKFCRHLHLPLQAATNEILTKMNRKYSVEQYKSIIEHVRNLIPDIAITTDLIVGFPGETDELFKQGCEFIEAMSFADMHIFKYSKRSGTPAAEMEGQILNTDKDARSREIAGIIDKSKLTYHQKFVGKILPVIIEQQFKDGDISKHESHGKLFEGHADNYMKLVFNANEEDIGKLVRVQVKQAGINYSMGEIVKDNHKEDYSDN